jgi:hypothetical protein
VKFCFLLLALAPLLLPVDAKAESTRWFYGKDPFVIEKEALEAGYIYPATEFDCSSGSGCRQQWVKEE